MKIVIILCTLLILGSFVYFKNNNSNTTPEENNTVQESIVENNEGYKIIAFGDSLTAGYGLNLEDSYPIQLEKKLVDSNYRVDVINAGISGETSFGNLERVEFIRNQKPDIVILGIGGNDALRGLAIVNTKNNIEKTIDVLQSGEEPPRVILLKIQSPSNLGSKYKIEFDSMYESIRKNKNIPLVSFVVDEVFLNKKYMLNDGIHPNKEGYSILIDKYIYPEIIRYLKK